MYCISKHKISTIFGNGRKRSKSKWATQQSRLRRNEEKAPLLLLSLFAFGFFEQAFAKLEASPVALNNNGSFDFSVECLLLQTSQRLNHSALLHNLQTNITYVKLSVFKLGM